MSEKRTEKKCVQCFVVDLQLTNLSDYLSVALPWRLCECLELNAVSGTVYCNQELRNKQLIKCKRVMVTSRLVVCAVDACSFAVDFLQ